MTLRGPYLNEERGKGIKIELDSTRRCQKDKEGEEENVPVDDRTDEESNDETVEEKGEGGTRQSRPLARNKTEREREEEGERTNVAQRAVMLEFPT